jgi:putative flavoprotein involved in K+ transport
MYHTIIIGAGHAGLVAAYRLNQQGQDKLLILEKSNQIAHSWRSRYAGLSLFTPRSLSALPGLIMPGDQQGFPSKDELADYLQNYAEHFNIPVRLNSKVCNITKLHDVFSIQLTDGPPLGAQQVIICNGAFQIPQVPDFANQLNYQVMQFTPQSIGDAHLKSNDKTWLVVGDGASGRQIAKQLSANNKVVLAGGKKRNVMPHKILGKSVFYWLEKLDLLKATKHSIIGEFMLQRDPFPGDGLSDNELNLAGIELSGRIMGANNKGVINKAGVLIKMDAIVWALGYNNNFNYLNIPGALDKQGNIIHHNGNSQVSGLHFLSQPWMRNRASGLIMGADQDFKQLNLLSRPAGDKLNFS